MKLVTWNAEWLEDHWGVVSGKYAPRSKRGRKRMPTMEHAEARLAAFRDLMARVAPDVLFICEGPKVEGETAAFAAANLPDHSLVTRPAGQKSNVLGDQGLWFFVRTTMWNDFAPELLDNAIWRDFTHAQTGSSLTTGKWKAVRPKLQDFRDPETNKLIEDVPVSRRASLGHYRHPQVLRLTQNGQLLEIIGVHLKSKFTGSSVRKRKDDEDFEDYAEDPRVKRFLAQAHDARVKLTSQATNVRAYIDHRFTQEDDPAVILLGDVNDGPGKELLEREYLLHDMISNLQGEIFFARRILYHALYDQHPDLRWTSEFKDKLDPTRNPHILLDHILYTQALSRTGTATVRLLSDTGMVEHRDYEEVRAIHGEDAMSDHRPISVLLAPRAPVG